MKCPICEQDQWIDGSLSARTGVYFVPARTKLLIANYPGLTAHACGSCGHVRLSVDVETLKSTVKK